MAGGYTKVSTSLESSRVSQGGDVRLVGMVIRPKMDTFIVGFARHHR